ncbi:MAG: lipopolysaccharide transport periplasmic protein LptA [Desulfobacterota bacterium]|nr:lipopolysaccharide transport periplasmic protein LptA [Thermodesulfobacteriota bacterium]
MRRWIAGWLLVLAFLFAQRVPHGETQEKRSGFGFTTSRAPIEITSDTVEGSQKENRITFKGNVVAKQEEATLHAHQMVVHYDSETKKIREIVATGNVRIVQLERRATCQRATFYQMENKVVLEGEVVLREGDNVVRGERMVYLLNEDRSYIEGGKGGRVVTTIVPPPKEEKKR